MMALLVPVSHPDVPAWLWVVCVLAIAGIPVSEWLRRDVRRLRFAVAFLAVVLLGGSALMAYYPPPGWTTECCDWLLAYGICWPIGWPGC